MTKWVYSFGKDKTEGKSDMRNLLGGKGANLAEMAKGTDKPEINRLLGTEGDLGGMFGLSKDWAVKAIAAGGNYGEIFARNIGESTAIGLARGLNAQWTNGGLIYSPPFR